MKRNLIHKVAVGILFGMATLFASTERADAAFVAWVCDDALCSGAGDVSLADGAGGDASAGVNGVISWTVPGGAVGYEVVVNIAQSKPALSNGMDLAYVVSNISGPTTGSIWLFAVDTDFNGTLPLSGALGGTNPLGGATTTMLICNADSNVNDFSPCSSSTFTGSGAFTLSAIKSVTASPYALAIGVQISGVAVGDTATGDLRVSSVPEPASLSLLGLGLAGVRAAVRRRRK